MKCDWQVIATGLCVILAAIVVLRNLLSLFSRASGSGCQTGCSACPSQAKGPASSPDFVPLQSLVDSGRAQTRH